jgi:DNA polymerase-3 subunit gamma/tau
LHLLQAISSTQPQTVMDSIEALAQNGVEWDGLLQQLAAQLHRVAMYQALPSSIDKAQPDAEKIQWLAKSLSPQDVQLYYQIAIKGRDDLSLSPTPRVGIEMITLRMMAFRPSQASVAQVISTQPAAVAPSQPQTVQPAPAPVSASQAPHAAPRVQPQPAEYERPSAPPPSVPEPMIEPVPQPAPQSASQPEAPVQQPTVESERKPSPMVGLRHQLRSQRQGLAQKGSDPKKPDAASAKPVSVLERVAQRGQHAAQMSPYSATSVDDTPDDEAYQWRPTQNLPVETQAKSELTPTQIKRALEHEKTPEMTEKLIHEAIELDQWASLIQRLHTAKLVEQLALNSTYKKNGASIELTLRPSHAHLNTDKAQSELLQALNDQLNEDCHLSVTIGEDGETPLELRERLYQGKLSRAIDNLVADPNVQFIERRFSAELDKDSVRPI